MAGSVFDGVDMTDPCAVWPVLQSTLDRLLAGEMVTRARFGDDDVEFNRGSIGALQSRIRELKSECEAKTSGRPRRFAIRAGFRRY